MNYIIRNLRSTDNRDHFDCGEPALDNYLQKFAHQHAIRNISQTYVAVLTAPEKIIGFYTLSNGSIDFQRFPFSIQKKLPKYPIPIILIGRLAVDKTMQGKGIGDSLLMDTLSRSVKLSKEVGIFAVVVEAKHDKDKAFYLKYGFCELLDAPFKLFLPVKTIMELMKSSNLV
jgi:predicted GNAT family N-acyltransferase